MAWLTQPPVTLVTIKGAFGDGSPLSAVEQLLALRPGVPCQVAHFQLDSMTRISETRVGSDEAGVTQG
jgi:hypothetical protein